MSAWGIFPNATLDLSRLLAGSASRKRKKRWMEKSFSWNKKSFPRGIFSEVKWKIWIIFGRVICWDLKIFLNPFKFFCLFIIYLHLSRNQFKEYIHCAIFTWNAEKKLREAENEKNFNQKSSEKGKIYFFCAKSHFRRWRAVTAISYSTKMFTQQSKPNPFDRPTWKLRNATRDVAEKISFRLWMKKEILHFRRWHTI